MASDVVACACARNPGMPTAAPAKNVARPEANAAVVIENAAGSRGQSRFGSSDAIIAAAKTASPRIDTSEFYPRATEQGSPRGEALGQTRDALVVAGSITISE